MQPFNKRLRRLRTEVRGHVCKLVGASMRPAVELRHLIDISKRSAKLYVLAHNFAVEIVVKALTDQVCRNPILLFVLVLLNAEARWALHRQSAGDRFFVNLEAQLLAEVFMDARCLLRCSESPPSVFERRQIRCYNLIAQPAKRASEGEARGENEPGCVPARRHQI